MTLWLLVQRLYHRATGDSWELRPLDSGTQEPMLGTRGRAGIARAQPWFSRVCQKAKGLVSSYKCLLRETGRLPTYPSPNPKFCPKGKILLSMLVWWGRGGGGGEVGKSQNFMLIKKVHGPLFCPIFLLVGILWLFVSTKSLFFSLLDPDVIYQRFSVQVLLRIYLGRNHA